jgi:hypothetical protein
MLITLRILISIAGCEHACHERVCRHGTMVRSPATHSNQSPLKSRRRYGGLLVLRGPQELSTGQLTAYILYVIYSVFAITQLVSTINSNAAASAAAARVDEILNRRPMAANDRGHALTNFRGLLEFKNVITAPPPLPHIIMSDVTFDPRSTSRTPSNPTGRRCLVSPSLFVLEQSLCATQSHAPPLSKERSCLCI